MSFKEKQNKVKNGEYGCKGSCEEPSENKDSKEKNEIENLKKELKNCKELLLRTAAEYDNFRKRSEKEKEAIYSDASSLAILSILPLADSLEAAERSVKNSGEECKKVTELLKNQMLSALKNLDVEPFGNIGDEFDPNFHNAIAHKEDENEKQNVISSVFQKGYKMSDRIIRHATVEVVN